MNRSLIVTISAIFALWMISSSLYTVDETQKALVVRLGKPLHTTANPGLKFKIPLINRSSITMRGFCPWNLHRSR